MGNQASVKKICFEDMQHIIKQRNRRYLIINTLLPMEQDCLIPSTIPSDKEEDIINSYMRGTKPVVVIYGKNTNDNSILKKYQQLEGLGFPRVYVYPGGMFEWLCLQDIYGKEAFATTGAELDILKFRPRSHLLTDPLLLENG
jgi:hypothetical protein